MLLEVRWIAYYESCFSAVKKLHFSYLPMPYTTNVAYSAKNLIFKNL